MKSYTIIRDEVVIFHYHFMMRELIDIYSLRCIGNSGAFYDNYTYFSIWGRKNTLNTMSYETDLQRAA